MSITERIEDIQLGIMWALLLMAVLAWFFAWVIKSVCRQLDRIEKKLDKQKEQYEETLPIQNKSEDVKG